jgi:U3 small nucleolar RNA-associated protein 25
MNFRGKKNYKKSNFKNNKNPKFKPKTKKKNTEDVGPKTKFQKNFRHIQRNKESEEGLRRQNETHAKYYQKLKMTQPGSESESEPEEDTANPFETLLSSLGNGKNQDKSAAIESSESEPEAESEEDEDSELEESDGDEEITENAADSVSGEDDAQESNSEEDDELVNTADESEDQEIEADDVSESEIAESESDEADDEPETHVEDPFNKHLDNDLSSTLLESVTESPQITHTEQLNWPQLGQLLCQIPMEKASKKLDAKKPRLCLDAEEVYATPGEVPEPMNHKKIDMDKCAIKTQIQPHLAAANEANLKTHKSSKLLTPLQSEVYSILNNYQDFYYPQRNFQNGEQLRLVYCLHALNHVLKTRTKVMHHNAALSKLSAKDKNAGIPDYCRDQGLVRPKVLILLPFRDSAFRVVNLLIQLLSPQLGSRVMNHKRYLDEFGGNSYVFSQKHPKPEDFEHTFAGNTDDNFRLGISLTKKCMKLYADYYNSDIIVASPLGLRMTIGAEGDEERDYDFLASMELLIVDQAEIFFMQNWDHVLHIFDHLHLQPQTTKNTGEECRNVDVTYRF